MNPAGPRPGSPFPTPVALPPIPGLVFRHFRDRSDFAAMNDVANGSRVADGVEFITPLEGFVNFYEHMPRTRLDRDVLIVEIEGRIVAYARVEVRDEVDGARILESICFIHPDRRRQGIGSAVLTTLEDHLRGLEAALPRVEARFFEVGGASGSPGHDALFRAFGYAPVRYSFTMVRPNLDDEPDAPLPPGLEVRDVRPEQMRQIWEAAAEAFRDEWGSAEATEEAYQQFLHEPLNDTSLWRVAWDGDQVAGMVLPFINRDYNSARGVTRGWVESISVRRPWRRRGLATALIASSFPLLRARGMTEGILSVDADNPSGALRLYERLGFWPIAGDTTWRKPFA